MSAELLYNLFAWSAQVCVLIAVAALAAIALKQPRARLWFWQATLALALLLPVLQPRVAGRAPAGEVAISTGPVTIRDQASSSSWGFRPDYVLILIGAGIGLRLLWLAIGLGRLRRHRLSASVLADPPFAAPHVRWYLCDTVSGPVTYGWLRPAILLPSSVDDLNDSLREAVACHELIHVERRDWLFVIAEELIRAVFWFHPAIWFVLGRIQLAREQAVDAEVIRRTRDRENYLNALVAVAEQKFSPAPLFLKKRQLALRVAAVLRETPMSKSRLLTRFATLFSVALLAARMAMWLFPMQGMAQGVYSVVPGDDPGTVVDAGAPLLHRVPVYRDAGVSASGTIVAEATVDSKGGVRGVRIVSGPEALGQSVLASVARWHYSTDPPPPSVVRITVIFPELKAAPEQPSGGAGTARIAEMRFIGMSPELEQKIRDRIPFREGDLYPLNYPLGSQLRDLDDHIRTGVQSWIASHDPRFLDPKVVLVFSTNDNSDRRPPRDQPNVAAPATTPPSRIRVGGNVQAANLVQKVVPAYPADAKEARIQGTVRFTATIGKDGKIIDLQLISGLPLLAQAAMDAVKQWVYRPTLLNGNPVEVITQIDVNFTLAE